MTWERKCWRSYQLPAGRTWESFRYLVEDLRYGRPVYEFVTDSENQRDRLVTAALGQGYEPRVTWRYVAETRRDNPMQSDVPASTP